MSISNIPNNKTKKERKTQAWCCSMDQSTRRRHWCWSWGFHSTGALLM